MHAKPVLRAPVYCTHNLYCNTLEPSLYSRSLTYRTTCWFATTSSRDYILYSFLALLIALLLHNRRVHLSIILLERVARNIV